MSPNTRYSDCLKVLLYSTVRSVLWIYQRDMRNILLKYRRDLSFQQKVHLPDVPKICGKPKLVQDVTINTGNLERKLHFFNTSHTQHSILHCNY